MGTGAEGFLPEPIGTYRQGDRVILPASSSEDGPVVGKVERVIFPPSPLTVSQGGKPPFEVHNRIYLVSTDPNRPVDIFLGSELAPPGGEAKKPVIRTGVTVDW